MLVPLAVDHLEGSRCNGQLTFDGYRGKSGDEIVDESFNLNNARRRSNSSIENAKSFKSKFETVDPEPVFEEEVHGDGGVNHFDADAQGGASEGENLELDKQSSSDSAESIASVEMDSATENKA